MTLLSSLFRIYLLVLTVLLLHQPCLVLVMASDVSVEVQAGPSFNGGSCPSPEATVRKGNYVRFHMTVSVDASSKAGTVGHVFQTTSAAAGDAPIGVTVGRDQIIPGLDMGLLGLCQGDSATIIVPPDLAYGDEGTGTGPDDIPPGATLRFVVDIDSILEEEPLDYDEELDEEEAKAMFHKADKNQDGVLSRDEFNGMFLDQIDSANDKLELESIHDQLQTFWEAQDHNKDDVLTMEEFLSPASMHSEQGSPEEEYNNLDTDQDGKLSRQEIEAFYAQWGQEEFPDDFWDALDRDGDGFVSMEEFYEPSGDDEEGYDEEYGYEEADEL